MRLRLSLLMFLLWAVPGSLLPFYSLRLDRQLGFDWMMTAACCATQAIASVVSSLLAGQIADRWVSAEKAMAVCAALAGLDLWLLADLQGPWVILSATLAFWLVAGPMLLLGTTIAFSHLAAPEREFGPIRLWGTVGWMVVGWMCSGWMAAAASGEPVPPYGETFRVGAVLALVLAGYSLTLPPTPPRRGGASSSLLAPLEALKLLRQGPFAAYSACVLGVCVTFPFTTQTTPLLLERLGITGPLLGLTLTLAQATEVFFLAALPSLLLHLGLRGTMAAGLVAWLAAMCALAAGQPVWLVVASLGLNGLYVTGFLIAGQVYSNSLAADDLRASVQGLFSFINGLGLLVGNLLAGALRHMASGDLTFTFAVGASVTAVMLTLFLAGFRQPAVKGKGVVARESSAAG